MHRVAARSHSDHFWLSCLSFNVYLHILSLCLNHSINLQALFWILLGHSKTILPCFLDDFFPSGWLVICHSLCFCTCCKIISLCLHAGYLLVFWGYRTHLLSIL